MENGVKSKEIEKEAILNLFKKGMQTFPMYRINIANNRLYASTEPFKIYSGLTGALACVTFKGNTEAKRIVKWRDKMVEHLGFDGQKAYLNSMADFGTLVHECIVRAWTQGKLNWDVEKEYAENYFRESAIQNGIEINELVVSQQVFEYCKNAASLMSFLHTEVSELYAVEGMAMSDNLEIATPVDIFCKLKTGQKATLNIKTSSQIGDGHREQVSMEKFLWNVTYKETADVTGIIRPKDWNIKKVPTYELEILKPDLEKKFLDSALGRLLLAKNDENNTYLNYPKEQMVFRGETQLGDTPKIETLTIEQLFNQ